MNYLKQLGHELVELCWLLCVMVRRDLRRFRVRRRFNVELFDSMTRLFGTVFWCNDCGWMGSLGSVIQREHRDSYGVPVFGYYCPKCSGGDLKRGDNHE